MAKENGTGTTQRAYTLRLRGADKNDNTWRDALWATHEAVNKGARVFGDWLLTLRGGLCHTLADAKVAQGKGKPERAPTDGERRDRSILLALSWLSVESEPRPGDPHEAFVVASGKESPEARDEKVLAEFRRILVERGVPATEIDEWQAHCEGSLKAMIRDDAVWVNRSRAFDATVSQPDRASGREDARIMLWRLFTDDYLSMPRKGSSYTEAATADSQGGEEPEESEAEKRRAVIVKSGKGAGQRTRHPFSHLFGEGRPFGQPKQSLTLREQWYSLLKPRIAATGIPLSPAKKPPGKKRTEDEPGRSPSELHREMFSKAASRLAQIWTKQKQQEVQREERKAADEALMEMKGNASFAEPLRLLAELCEQRKDKTGALGVFRIAPRQITGWSRVVDCWATITQNDEAAREEAVRGLQSDDSDGKFGDVNLFIELASERFRPVWFHDGMPDATLLQHYVRGMRARADADRLKVASYRHPDACFNPVFCQFGNSRPPIKFRRLEAFTREPAGQDHRAVGMLLWNPARQQADLRILLAASRRFDHEIGSSFDVAPDGIADQPRVSRRSRLAGAAVNLDPTTGKLPAVAGVFDRRHIDKRTKAGGGEQEDDAEPGATERNPQWNGTLSADRHALTDLGKLLDGNASAAVIRQRRNALRWTLIVSVELEQQGPWYEYITHSADPSPFQRTVPKNEASGQKRPQGTKFLSFDRWPFEETNKPLKPTKTGTSLAPDARASRGPHAAVILSRLPGLRVLSVDLGHRYAAACAVWETLTREQFENACSEARAKAPHGWQVAADGDLYAMIEGPEQESNHATKKARAEGRVRKFRPTTVYRRIGADTIVDPATGQEKPHPAPWARLDRQFLIKLPGEDRPARTASPGEQEMVADFAARLGLAADDEKDDSRTVDELMSRAVRIATLALRRHARRAKIAWALDPERRSILVKGKETTFEPGDAMHVQLLTDALLDWHSLANESKWDDKAARELWNASIAGIEGERQIETTAPKPDDRTRQQRRKDEDAVRERLKPVAERLVKTDRSAMHQAWKARWEEDDGPERHSADFEHAPVKNAAGKTIGSTSAAKRPTSGFHADIRWLTDWIMGKRLPGENEAAWRLNVGGLSLTRIATMRSLYQLHKAFAMRARPDKPRGAPEKGEGNAGVGQSILDAMDRMREQRVKQLASRIAEAALGIGRMKPPEDGTDHKRPRESQDAPCHAVVIENLTDYRPEETRTRRENRQLMSWSSSKVKKHLAEACQLHGLHLREVKANYTSRQDSRTAAPGVRCADVPVADFLTKPWWRQQVDMARKKIAENKADARSRYLADLADRCASAAGQPSARTVRVPLKGGDLFVSVDAAGRRRAIQADLNAAANIGLKALLDPDWPGKWWYVPCDPATLKPRADKVKGSAALDGVGALAEASGTKPPKSRDVVNEWRDCSIQPVRGVAGREQWLSTTDYWKDVEARVVAVLRNQAGLSPDLSIEAAHRF